MKTTLDIGYLSGKILVFGGAYGNYESLTALKRIAFKENIPPSQIFCTGDILGQNSSSNFCLQLIRKWGIHVIHGKREKELCKYDNLVHGALRGSIDHTTAEYTMSRQLHGHIHPLNMDWLNALPDLIRFNYSGFDGLLMNSKHGIHELRKGQSKPSVQSTNSIMHEEIQLVIVGQCKVPYRQTNQSQLCIGSGAIGGDIKNSTGRLWYVLLEGDKFIQASFYCSTLEDKVINHNVGLESIKEKLHL